MTAKVRAKAAAAKSAVEPRDCNFCRRDDRLSLVRLIVGTESRLVWVCPDHRG